jgi:hypothetical protein
MHEMETMREKKSCEMDKHVWLGGVCGGKRRL